MNWQAMAALHPSICRLLGPFWRCPNIDIKVATQFELPALEWHKAVDLAAHLSTT